jgi:predicted permease
MFNDIRYGIRILRRAPGFTITAILTLALGIGANVAMFSVVYGVLLRPLPYSDPGQLVLVRAEARYEGASRPVPLTVFGDERLAWQRPFDAVSSLAFFATGVDALATSAGSEVIDSATVSGSFFDTLGGPFAAGRALAASDNGLPVVVVSESLAQRLFGAAEAAIGRELRLANRTHTIVGVAARSFQFPTSKVSVWLPAGFVQTVNPRCCGFRIVARLDSGGTLERLEAAVRPMFESSANAKGGVNQTRTIVVRLTDDLVATVKPVLLVLLSSVGLVLLIACGNLINLLLARNIGRQGEFAVRRALGAPAPRLVRQLLIESALLVAAGAACGLLLARPALTLFSRLAGDKLPRAESIHLDPNALAFAIGIACVAVLLTGVFPALRAARASTLPQQGAERTSTSMRTRRLQQAMCAVQVALAVTLLIGATLMGRSLAALLRVDLGVSTDHVLTTTLNLGFGGRPTDAQTIARVNRVVERAQALPGIRAAGAGTSLPPRDSRMRVTLKRTGDTVDYQASAVPVTPGYFSALEMRLLQGRFFTDEDDDRRQQVMIMSETTARRFFGSGDVIGRTMTLPLLRDGRNTSVEMTLVGVTSNVKYAGLAAPPDDIVYRPFAQQPWIAPFLVVRTAGDPSHFAPTLRRAIAEADSAIVTSSLTTLDEIVLDEVAQPQFRAVLLGSLAGLALAIAAIGLYGVVAYAVSQRAREFGIRLALGATARDVLGMVLTEGLFVGLAGIAAGTVLALLLTKLLSDLLYGVTPTDSVSFVIAGAALLTLTLIASYVPARRAARIDPVRSLRNE